MMGAETSVALAAAALATTTLAAVRVRGIARVFLIAQVAYWSLSYVARPAVLLWVQPRAQFADNIADPRLASIGYDRGIALVMQPVVFGLWAYAAVVVAYAIWSRNRKDTTPARRTDTDLVATLGAVYVLGMLGRAAAYLSGSSGSAGDLQSSNAILSFVASLGTVGALGLIIFLRSSDRRVPVVAIGGLLFGELLWTVAVQSKTPIMSAALAVAVRFALHGWSRQRVAAIAAVSIGGIGGFGWLQAFKQSAEARSASAIIDSQYPPLVHPFLSVLRRFDLLEAATDGYYMGGRPWLSFGQVLGHVLESLVPAQLLGSDKFRSGTAWANEVRGSSVDMTRVAVSLADGNINEGYVLGGYPGVVVGVLFVFGLLLFGVWALRARHIVFVVLGLALIASPMLFERGILGSMELVGKSLQIVGLVWIIDLTVRELRRRPAGSLDGMPRHRTSAHVPGLEQRTEQWD